MNSQNCRVEGRQRTVVPWLALFLALWHGLPSAVFSHRGSETEVGF